MRVLGVVAASLAGLSVLFLLPVYADRAEEANILHLVGGGMLAVGTVLSFGTIVSLALAPFFIPATYRAAYRAIRLTRFWPEEQYVRLEFRDEGLADSLLDTDLILPKKKFDLKPVTPRF